MLHTTGLDIHKNLLSVLTTVIWLSEVYKHFYIHKNYTNASKSYMYKTLCTFFLSYSAAKHFYYRKMFFDGTHKTTYLLQNIEKRRKEKELQYYYYLS